MRKKRKEKTEEPVKPEDQMAKLNEDKPDEKKLFFDFVTGSLEVKKDDGKNENNIVVDQIYKDGFFNRDTYLTPLRGI